MRLGQKIHNQAIRTHREVGELMGLSGGAVYMAEKRMFEKLAEQLGELEDWARDELPPAEGRWNGMRGSRRRQR